MLNKGIFSLSFLFPSPFCSIYLRKIYGAFEIPDCGRKKGTGVLVFVLQETRFQPGPHSPMPGLCLHRVPPLSLRKWGALKVSGQGSGNIYYTCALGHGSGSAVCAGDQEVGEQTRALQNLSCPSFSLSPLLPPCDTLLFPPCSLFSSSSSIPLSPSAPPAACQLPADDISFHVWG